MPKKKYVFKILIAGQGGVGKTTLLNRAVTGKFISNTSMTIGVEFHLLNVTLGDASQDDNLDVTLQAWDFGGQERFRFMLDSYVAGARGALLLYDLTRLRTLDNLQEWVDIVRKQDPNLPILFVGTKLDRVEDITVADEYALEFLEPLEMFDHIKISSKDGTNIEEVFKKIAREILRINGVEVPEEKTEDTVEPIATEELEDENVEERIKETTPQPFRPFIPPSSPPRPAKSTPAPFTRPFIPPVKPKKDENEDNNQN